jgi:hypothetical protein
MQKGIDLRVKRFFREDFKKVLLFSCEMQGADLSIAKTFMSDFCSLNESVSIIV